MIPTKPTSSPRLLLGFFRVFALLGFIPFLINTVDLLLHLTAPSLDPQFETGLRLVFGLLAAPLSLALAVLCIRRAPGNLIGWMLVAFSYGMSVQVIRADLLPLPIELMVANLFVGIFWFAFLLTPLYFPDGRLYPPRIHHWGNLLVSGMIFGSLLVSNLCNPQLTWGSPPNQLVTPNPFRVFEWDYTVVTIPMISFLLAAGILTVILRYRGSREQERLQLRWLLFGVLVQGILTLVTFGVPVWNARFATWISALYGLIIPFAVAIAVLRYRLYDIDLIIRRTLQYGLLTTLLGLVYFGGVTLLQQVFTSLAGQQSPLAVVLSTLVIAVLFTPLRRGLQIIIDRRFYRRKYDAEAVVGNFTNTARNEMAVATLGESLVRTARETLEPQSISLWLAQHEEKR